MKKIFLTVLFLSASFLFTAFSFAGITPECPPLTIFSDIADSGIKTYVVQIPRSPVVSVKIYFRGGAFGENEKRGSGLAHAVQTILYENIRKGFDNSEGSFTKLNSETYYDSIYFSANSVKENLPSIIKKLSDKICDAKFSAKQWEKTRDKLTNQILFEKDNPWKQLDTLLKRTAFMWDPVKFSINGNVSLLNDLLRDDLISYYKKYFVADNLIVVVAGDVNPENVSSMVKKAFADLPDTSGVLPEKFDSPIQTAPRWLEQHGSVTQSYISVGFSTAGAGHPDTASLHLLSDILKKEELEKLLSEGTENFSNFKICVLNLPGNPEEFIVSFSCDENSAANAASLVKKYIINLSNYAWNKKNIEGKRLKLFTDYLASMNSPKFISEFVGKSALQLGNPHYPEINAKNILEITPQKLSAVCKKYFVPQRLSIAILSPERSSDEILGLQKAQLLRGERALLGETHIPIQRIELKNGVKILLRRIPDSPVVNFIFSGIGGLWCEDETNNGVFSIIAEIMRSLKYTKTKKLFFKKKEKENEDNIYPKANSHNQTFTLSATVIPELASEAAKNLCRAWMSPELNEKNISFSINNLLKKIDTQITNIPQLADAVFRASFFTKQPYRLNFYGNQLSLPIISQQTVSDFYNDFIIPQNTTILISGNFDENEIKKVIENSLKNFREKDKSAYFTSNYSKYKFNSNSNAPVLVVNLSPENKITNQFTRVFSSPNHDAVIVCGIPVPGLNSTNFSRYITKVVRAAMLNQIENLNTEWTDFQKNKILNSFDVVDYQGWNTGWVYAYFVLPDEYASEGLSKLRALFSSTLSGLADGKFLERANARAVFENEFSGSKNILKNIVISELFALPKEYGSSLKHEIYNYSQDSFRQLFNQYGKYPVSAIVAPEE
ncbi:insulinase family protein [bacterium]|nr:insulinase family protein [bacterium]